MARLFHRYRSRILLCLAAVLLALAAAEGLLRVFGYHYEPFRLHVGGQTPDWRYQHTFDDPRFVCDPDLIWRPQPGRSIFNAQGFRGSEAPPDKPPDEFRIVTVGDSNTVGWIPGNGATGVNWPECLERILTGAGHKKVRVLNAAVWGYSSQQGVGRLKEMLIYRPDLVLVSFGANDAHRVAVSDDDFNAAIFKTGALNVRLVQLLKAVWDHRRARNADDLVFRVGPGEYRENLRRMVRMCRDQGVGCVLLTRPFLGESDSHLCWKTYAPQYVAATIALGGELDVPVVDLHGHFKTRPECFSDESHFTEDAHRQAAEFIADAIRPLVKE